MGSLIDRGFPAGIVEKREVRQRHWHKRFSEKIFGAIVLIYAVLNFILRILKDIRLLHSDRQSAGELPEIYFIMQSDCRISLRVDITLEDFLRFRLLWKPIS